MPRLRPLVLVLLAIAAFAPAAPARPFRTPSSAAPWAIALGEADSLLRVQRVDEGLRRSAEVRADAAAHGERWTVMATYVLDAAANGMMGRAAAAEISARTALDMARVQRDADYQRRARRWLAFALGQQGRAASADSLWRVLLRESTAARDTAHVGYAELGIAYGALASGEPGRAVPHYRAAVRWLVLGRDTFLAATARIGLARSLTQLGDVDGARGIYQDILAEAERSSRGRAAADALNNLGTLEMQAGDREEAVSYWQRSVAAFRKASDPASAVIPLGNLSLALAEGGHPDVALAVADSGLADVRRLNRPELEASLWLKRAGALVQLERLDEAWAACSRARALLPPTPEKQVMDVRLEQYNILGIRGTPRERLEFAERELPPLLPFATGLPQFQMTVRLADANLGAGRYREALAHAVRAESIAVACQLSSYAPAAWLVAARAQRALGDAPAAMATLRHARLAWDSLRVAARDPVWREREGQRGTLLSVELADVMLSGHEREPARLAAAWEMLQSGKSRTLLERMQGPLAFASGAVRTRPVTTLARLRGALRPGEMLLDAFAGDRVTLLFAVSARGVRVARLPGADSLAARLKLYPRLLAQPGGEGAAAMLSRATDAVSDLVLAPLAAELGAATRVVLSPDGPLQQLPFAELTLPGAPRRTALSAGRELCRVPSATVFVELRTRAAAGAGAHTLAWAGGSAPGRPALPGAAAEVAWMSARLADVTAKDGAHASALPTAAALASFDVLHFAAHARLLPRQPWGSALLLADGARCAEPWLRADRVARMRLRARLAVLSGCETGGGENLAGEGVLGLSSAFLAAGTSSVVASLWRVDDRATGAFMRAFYGALARGATVSGALGAAQRTLAADPATAAPFYWAGFVVAGDGAVRVPMHERSGLHL